MWELVYLPWKWWFRHGGQRTSRASEKDWRRYLMKTCVGVERHRYCSILPSAQCCKNLKTLECKVLYHLPYSPDIYSSDYHLFRSMIHDLSDKRFTSYEDTKKKVDSWITSKDESFLRRGIRMLSERLKRVVTSDEQYFEWSTGYHFFKIKPLIYSLWGE